MSKVGDRYGREAAQVMAGFSPKSVILRAAISMWARMSTNDALRGVRLKLFSSPRSQEV
jgi:hypothetical protein